MSLGKIPLIRILIAIPAMIFAGSLAAASGAGAATDGPGRANKCQEQGHPSKLDYLVLASIADSPHLMAMASYRPERTSNGTDRSYPTED